MKTKEFMSKLDELGYNVQDGGCVSYAIHDANADFVGEISREMNNVLRLYTDDYKLIELCLEYAKTPIEERGEQKKYYVVLPDEERKSYLNIVPVLKRFEGKIIIVLEDMRKVLAKEWFHLTKEEIKRSHAYLWEFREEVTEL